MIVLAIDPGPVESAYIFWNGINILDKGLVNNYTLLDIVYDEYPSVGHMAIEMISSYGMPVGKDVFETVIWIGRFIERWTGKYRLVYRREVKLHICESMKATDANIRQALVDRFANGAANHGKGTKAEPSIFYGFKKDLWQAMAVAVFAFDTRHKNEPTPTNPTIHKGVG